MIFKTAVLLAGFGGPEKPSEIRPFIKKVVRGAKIPAERIEEVARHYELVGGASDYNKITFRQQKALDQRLKEKGLPVKVFAGFMHSKPGFTQVFLELEKKGFRRALIFVLSVFRSYPSFEKYQEKLEEAQRSAASASGGKIEILYADSFHKDPLFTEAVSQRILEVTKKFSLSEWSKTHALFTAHSIPLDWAEKSEYAEEFHESAERVAKKLNLGSWDVAYQSRSGPAQYPWLEPDVHHAIRALPKGKFTRVVLIPIGFLCDNVEVTYDLDIQAKETAQGLGLHYSRALTVMDHPVFIEMIADLIKKRSA